MQINASCFIFQSIHSYKHLLVFYWFSGLNMSFAADTSRYSKVNEHGHFDINELSKF